jgi:L-amino acid N-acyltransferase YncA
MPTIRPSNIDDIPFITAIYKYHVLHGTGTFEIDPPGENEMALRRTDVLTKGLPYLVIVENDQILGFAYCNWFKPRPAYRFSAEDSIYLSPKAQGQGWGRLLLTALMHEAASQGVRKMIAVIGDSANIGSIKLHASMGFNTVGTLKSCGWKFDQWRDVVLMDISLGLGDSAPPHP